MKYKKIINMLFASIAFFGLGCDAYSDVQPPELRVGGMYYKPRKGDVDFKRKPEISIQYLFNSLGNDHIAISTNPRPHIGCTLNLDGGTSQYYAGLTWHIPVEDLFIELGLGGEIHNGPLERKINDKRRALGSRFLFRESVAVGININENTTASIILDHSSNADMFPPNSGLTGIGFQIGYKF